MVSSQSLIRAADQSLLQLDLQYAAPPGQAAAVSGALMLCGYLLLHGASHVLLSTYQ